jgi:hypothetical protein
MQVGKLYKIPTENLVTITIDKIAAQHKQKRAAGHNLIVYNLIE